MRKIFAVAALIIASPLLAQENSDSSKTLDHVVITTNKYFKKQSETGKVITVLDRVMLDKMGGRTIGEILNVVAGTTVNGANNNLGTNQRLSIRGSSDGNVLVLLDGVPVNDPSVLSNYYDLNFINTDNIERVEILRGAQSTLYGSDAVAGVVNIITKKEGKKTISPYLSTSYGSYNTFSATAGLRGKTNKLGYNLSTSHTGSRGFSSAYDSTGQQDFDNDGYSQQGGNLWLGYDLTKSVQLELMGKFSKYKADIDQGAFRDDNDFEIENRNAQAGIAMNWMLKKGRLRAQYHFNDVERNYLDDSTDRSGFGYFSRSAYTGRTHFAEIYATQKMKNIELLGGLDFRNNSTVQNYFSVSMFGPYEQEPLDTSSQQYSVYASLVAKIQELNVEIGGRFNRHSEYGSNATFSFNPSYLINNRVKIFGNISSGYKVPTLYQLFDPFSGNPELEPEESINYELGSELFFGSGKFRVTGFLRNTDNAIQYITVDPANWIARYTNINKQINKGIEAEFSLRQNNWDLNLNYTYTKSRIESGYTESGDELPADTSYTNLYRVPSHSFNAFLSYQIQPKLTTSVVARYIGERFEPIYMAAPYLLEDYFLLDLSTQYRVKDYLKIFLDLKNLLNQEYFDIRGYNSRKFNFTAGLHLSF